MWPSTTPPVGYPDLTPPVEPLPILTVLPERQKQRRWTVLLRFFLALPLTVVVFFVEIATLVCVFLGWFAALATGRAPGFVRTMVTVLLRMLLRLEAYTFLLTDRFPPFATQDPPGSGTSLIVPPATKLHRAAVLFRLILVIPASIAVRITGLGLQVVAFVMWFVVLITGWLPKPVHEAYQVFIRYEVRSSVTSTSWCRRIPASCSVIWLRHRSWSPAKPLPSGPPSDRTRRHGRGC